MKLKSLSSRVSFVVAISLYFSVLEAALPHPFYFRYGFAYIPLLVFSPLFTVKEWCIVVFFKVIISAIFSLSFLSVGFVLTLFSSISSGLIIYVFSRIVVKGKRLFSPFGVSIVSSFTSTSVQFLLSYILLFKKVSVLLLAPLVLTSLFSSCVVGWCAIIFEEKFINLFEKRDEILESENNVFSYKLKGKTIFSLFLSLFFIIFFIFLSSLLSPEGEVLYKWWIFTFASSSLLNALYRSLIIIIMFLISIFVSYICIKKGKFKNALIFKYYLYFLSFNGKFFALRLDDKL